MERQAQAAMYERRWYRHGADAVCMEGPGPETAPVGWIAGTRAEAARRVEGRYRRLETSEGEGEELQLWRTVPDTEEAHAAAERGDIVDLREPWKDTAVKSTEMALRTSDDTTQSLLVRARCGIARGGAVPQPYRTALPMLERAPTLPELSGLRVVPTAVEPPWVEKQCLLTLRNGDAVAQIANACEVAAGEWGMGPRAGPRRLRDNATRTNIAAYIREWEEALRKWVSPQIAMWLSWGDERVTLNVTIARPTARNALLPHEDVWDECVGKRSKITVSAGFVEYEAWSTRAEP